MLKKTLLGFFPGSRIETFYDENCKKMMNELKVRSVSSVTSVADYKRNEDTVTNKDFIQGLEKFVYAMQGTAYTAVFLADSVSYGQLMERRREYESICTQISPFANMQLNFSVSDGQSASSGRPLTPTPAVLLLRGRTAGRRRRVLRRQQAGPRRRAPAPPRAQRTAQAIPILSRIRNPKARLTP